MKKLLLVIIIALFAINVKAQIPLTKELTCTEQAFTLRLDIRSGWHPGMVRIGSAQVASYATMPTVDYFPINYNIKKAKTSGSSFFHSDSKPGIGSRSLLFDKNSSSILGFYSKSIYRDSLNFFHNYK